MESKKKKSKMDTKGWYCETQPNTEKEKWHISLTYVIKVNSAKILLLASALTGRNVGKMEKLLPAEWLG